MFTLRKRWRLRTLMGLIVLVALGMAVLRKKPDLGPVYRLKYGDPQGRMSAAVELGMLGPKKGKFAEPALLAALNDSNQGVCDIAAWALDRFGSTSPALVKALVKQVEVETWQSRSIWQGDFYGHVDPTQALTRIKPPAGALAPLLGKAMTNPDPWIRSRALTLLRDAIGWSGAPTPSVFPLLLTALRDKEPSIRRLFGEELVKLDGETRRQAVAILVQRLQSTEPADVLEATVGLARFGPDAEPAVKILGDRLQTGDLADRLATLYLLGRLGPLAKPAVPAILRAMTARDAGKSKPDFLNRFWRRSPVWNPGDPGITIDTADRDASFKNLRDFAVMVLGRIGPEAEREGIHVFIKMLGADTVEDRRLALESLAKLGPKAASAIPALIALIDGTEPAAARSNDSNLIFAIFRAIHQVGSGDNVPLVDTLGTNAQGE
jgi:HEAT repeat protein